MRALGGFFGEFPQDPQFDHWLPSAVSAARDPTMLAYRVLMLRKGDRTTGPPYRDMVQ